MELGQLRTRLRPLRYRLDDWFRSDPVYGQSRPDLPARPAVWAAQRRSAGHGTTALPMLNLPGGRVVSNRWALGQARFMLIAWALQVQISSHTKRVLDLILCALLIPLALPFMLITALAIRLDSPGPVIFKQERVGKWGKPFLCFKFRSMQEDADSKKAELLAFNESDQVVFKMKRDPRVTRVGRIIRKLSIDELPQLFNVLRGEMSLVGPRPPVPFEVAQYEYDHLRRLDAVPGITGLQQISGRSEVDFPRWVALDVQYIQEQSLRKDIEILLKTIPTVITGKGAY